MSFQQIRRLGQLTGMRLRRRSANMLQSVLTGHFHAGDSFMKVHGGSSQKPTGVPKCGVCPHRSGEKYGPSNCRPTSRLPCLSAALRPPDPTSIHIVIWQRRDSYLATISRACRSMPMCRLELGASKATYLQRARFLAIAEFGPRSLIYHEGRAYRVTKAKLPPGRQLEDAGRIPTETLLCLRSMRCGS